MYVCLFSASAGTTFQRIVSCENDLLTCEYIKCIHAQLPVRHQHFLMWIVTLLRKSSDNVSKHSKRQIDRGALLQPVSRSSSAFRALTSRQIDQIHFGFLFRMLAGTLRVDFKLRMCACMRVCENVWKCVLQVFWRRVSVCVNIFVTADLCILCACILCVYVLHVREPRRKYLSLQI
jgi:hypothetical protein